jgi:hypothetical protein
VRHGIAVVVAHFCWSAAIHRRFLRRRVHKLGTIADLRASMQPQFALSPFRDLPRRDATA